MKYNLPELPQPMFYKTEEIEPNSVSVKPEVIMSSIKIKIGTTGYTPDQMRQYAEQAVAPLLAEIERLEDLILELQEQISSMQD